MNRLASLATCLLLSTTFALNGTGCATATPPKASPSDPVTVFVTDYGIHSSLILPVKAEDGVYIEYAFGDFGYAALNRDGPIDALGALFLSFGSGIGRQYLRVPPGGRAPIVTYEPKTMTRIIASRAKVAVLLLELEARFNNGDGPTVYNDITKLNWRKDSTHYGAFNNCNHLTARQLRTLGYDVRGLPIFPPKVTGETIDPHALKEPSKDAGGSCGSR